MVLFDVESIANAIQGLYIPSFEAIILAIFVAIIPVGVGFYIYCRQERILIKQLEIANQQNKIALFEKRYELYRIYSELQRKLKLCEASMQQFEKGISNRPNQGIFFYIWTTSLFVSNEMRKQLNRYINMGYIEPVELAMIPNLAHQDVVELIYKLEQLVILFKLKQEEKSMLSMFLQLITEHNDLNLEKNMKVADVKKSFLKILDYAHKLNLQKTLEVQLEI